MKDYYCEIQCVNPRKVRESKANSLSEREILSLAEIFGAMGDSTRIKILHTLSQGEFCVCELAEIINMSQSAVSHQLRVLRNLRLVKHRKEGKMVFYSLDDDHIIQLFTQGLAHIRHN